MSSIVTTVTICAPVVVDFMGPRYGPEDRHGEEEPDVDDEE